MKKGFVYQKQILTGRSNISSNTPSGGKVVFPMTTGLYFIADSAFPYITDEMAAEFFSGVDTSNMLMFENLFFGDEEITTMPLFDTGNGRNLDYMFAYCTALENLPVFDTRNAIRMNGFVDGCENLSDESLDNILQMCINATSYEDEKNNYAIGLSTEYYSRVITLPHYQDFVNAGWTMYDR